MVVQFNRTTITPVWIGVFGLLGLLWSLLSIPMGVLLLMVGLAGPVVLLILSSETRARSVPVVPRIDRPQKTR